MHMRGLLERMILPITAAQGCGSVSDTFHFRNRLGGTQSNKPPLVCASVKQKARATQECCSIPQWHLPFRDFVLAAAGNTVLRDERENFAADHRHFRGDDLCADAAGAAHRGEMSEQTKASHIDSRANQAALSQLGADDVQLAT